MEYNPPLGSSGIRARIAQFPVCGRLIAQLLEVPSPFFHKNSPADDILSDLLHETRQRTASPLILNIGSRSKHKERIINLDVAQNGNAHVIGDATYMPFADNCFDLILNIAVMEHTRSPHLIASECHRVLKPGGKLYCTIPFFQMFHPDPIDIQRYTVTGIANLFRDLTPIESGVELGPASALSLTLREFLAILLSFNSRTLYNLLQVVFGYLTYPIKFLDYFLARHQFAFMIACSVYFAGEKKG